MVQQVKPWTWEEIKFVSDLASKGYSAKNIALELVGRNKNSVIGICHRRGIPLLQRTIQKEQIPHPRPKKEREKRRGAKFNIKNPNPVRVPPMKIVEVPVFEDFVPLNKTLDNLRYFECRAIVGPIKHMDTLYCGHPVVPSKSWCPYHFKIYTIPNKKVYA